PRSFAGVLLVHSYGALPDVGDPGDVLSYQADHGIRDRHVTGVQTCALPILKTKTSIVEGFDNLPNAFRNLFTGDNFGKQVVQVRSEERRVGKECISR